MDNNHRDVFFNLLLGIQLLFHEALGTEREYIVGHIYIELLKLSDEYDCDDGEILAIAHNAGQMIQSKPLYDIDESIERYKLLELLRDTKFIDLIR